MTVQNDSAVLVLRAAGAAAGEGERAGLGLAHAWPPAEMSSLHHPVYILSYPKNTEACKNDFTTHGYPRPRTALRARPAAEGAASVLGTACRAVCPGRELPLAAAARPAAASSGRM
jgi:hypothetical protein